MNIKSFLGLLRHYIPRNDTHMLSSGMTWKSISLLKLNVS